MKDITTLHSYRCDLNVGPCEADLNKPLMHQDALADTFRVAVCRDMKPIDLSDTTVYGYLYFIATNQTLPLSGTVDKHYASVTLTDDCYTQPGLCSLVIQLLQGDVRHTVLKVDFIIKRTGSGNLYPPGISPTLADLISRIEALEQGGGSSGGSGGYYTPDVTQTADATMRVSFAPSKAGMPVVTPVDVTLPQGPAGDPGRIPVKGADYYTPADQEDIVQQVITALGTPVFGHVDSDNSITLTGNLADGTYTLKYEDKSGALVTIGTLSMGTTEPTDPEEPADPDEPTDPEEPSRPQGNQIPYSTDTDGSVFNGTGYAVGKRINSSGAVADVANPSATQVIFLTGFIPVKQGEVVRMKNCFFDTNEVSGLDATYGQNTWGISTCFYDSEKNRLHNVPWSESAQNNYYTCTPDASGYVTEFTITADVGYVRLNPAPTGDASQAIITVNEEIE